MVICKEEEDKIYKFKFVRDELYGFGYNSYVWTLRKGFEKIIIRSPFKCSTLPSSSSFLDPPLSYACVSFKKMLLKLCIYECFFHSHMLTYGADQRKVYNGM